MVGRRPGRKMWRCFIVRKVEPRGGSQDQGIRVMSDPNQVQQQINAVPWTNGQGLITGATMFGLLTAIVGIFALYAPLASPTFSGTVSLPVTTTVNGVPIVTAFQTCESIGYFGGVGDGVTDNLGAWNKAIGALGSTGGCIYFPHGKYSFSNQIAWTPTTTPSVLSIRGDGADASILYFATGNGLVINTSAFEQTFNVDSVSFATGSVANGAAITANSSMTTALVQSSISNTTFRGDDFGYIVPRQYWSIGVNVFELNNITFLNDNFIGSNASNGLGVGVSLLGNSVGPVYAFNYFFVNSNFGNLQYGIQINSYVQGVYVNNTSFSGQFGIDELAPSGIICCVEVTNSNFSDFFAGIIVQGTNPLTQYQISNSIFYINAGGWGVDMSYDGGGSIIGNTFLPAPDQATSTNTGVELGNTTSGVGSAISGNIFFELATGILLDSTSARTAVVGNSLNSNTTSISALGSEANIANNVGFNPVGVTSGAYAPGSTVTYTAGPTAETHFLTGGTVTAVKIPNNTGATICSAACTVPLAANGTFSVTYSVAPTDTVSKF